MTKLYFRKDSEMCYDLATIKDEMRSDGISEETVTEAEIERGTGMFWCNEFFEIGDSSEGTCGRTCDGYKPRNGKNGICVHHRNPYCHTDREKVVKVNLER